MKRVFITLIYFAILLSLAHMVQLKYESLSDTIQEQVKKRDDEVNKKIKDYLRTKK